jgi:hypothetical protein
LVLGPSVGPNPSTYIKSSLGLPSPHFFCSILVPFPVFYQTLLIHLTYGKPPFYMTSRQAPPFHGTRTRERVKADAACSTFNSSFSLGRERERALRRSSSLSAQASGISCLSSPPAQTKCVRPHFRNLFFTPSLLSFKNIYMQIHKLAPLAYEFPKEVVTSNIMLPSCTTYTRKCVPGEKGFGSEYPHQSDGSYRCTHALVELSCRFRATRAVGGQGV